MLEKASGEVHAGMDYCEIASAPNLIGFDDLP
jgi:hypothetical protein